MDSLSQILTQANVQANSKLLLVDGCNGLVLAALMEKMAGKKNIHKLLALCITNYIWLDSCRDVFWFNKPLLWKKMSEYVCENMKNIQLTFSGFGTIIDFYAQDSMAR